MTAVWLALPLIATIALIGMLGITLLNLFTFPRLRPSPPTETAPLVSILIPARNEAMVIKRTLNALLMQRYLQFEIIVLNDNSTDGTGQLARQFAATDSRVRVLDGKPLAVGWLGKNWACHQLAQAAQGDILLFTDADVYWKPHALGALVAHIHRAEADLLTIWPTQKTFTWGERLVVPLMALVILGYLPILGVHYLPIATMAAANGQCLAFRRQAYEAIGGHKPVRDNVLEDVTLARLIKAQRFRLRMADGAGLIRCRMYPSWEGVRAGFAKNILAGYGNQSILLLLATLFHWLVFVLPWLWLAVGWLPAVSATLLGWPWWPLALMLLGVTVRALTAYFTRQRVSDALLMPVSVLLMTVIAFQSIWWQWRYGGPRWKGRLIKRGSHG